MIRWRSGPRPLRQKSLQQTRVDGLERTAEFNSVSIQARMGQQRHRGIEGSRWVVGGAARRECGREPGLFEQHPGGKPLGGHLGLEILLQSDAPCAPECPIRKVRRFDHPREHLWGKVAQSEPRLDGVGTVVQPPMGRGKPIVAVEPQVREYMNTHGAPPAAAPRRPGRLDTAREGARGLQTDTGSDAMRMQIVSDLHLEFGNPVPDLAAGVDIVVLAGDLAEIRHPWLLAEAVQAWEGAEHILYVPGNHEYYGSDIDEGRRILAGQCRIHGVTLLDPGAVTIAGVRFIGATLWTDFRLDGIANEPGAHAEAQRRISDFNGAIRQREGTRRFTTFESVRRHEAERAFIERELTAATETGTTAVVITHHAPTPRSVGPRFEGDPCNAAFASDLEGVIAQYQPPLWIHGHMHNRVDVALGETRVLCNPAGYNALANARHGYDPEFCIEIDAGGCA